jgi:hypothetical protein
MLFSNSCSSGPAQGAAVHNHVAIRLNIDDHIPDRRCLLLRRRRLWHFHVELVLSTRCIPREQEKNQKKQQHIDQRRKLNAGMMQRARDRVGS